MYAFIDSYIKLEIDKRRSNRPSIGVVFVRASAFRYFCSKLMFVWYMFVGFFLCVENNYIVKFYRKNNILSILFAKRRIVCEAICCVRFFFFLYFNIVYSSIGKIRHTGIAANFTVNTNSESFPACRPCLSIVYVNFGTHLHWLLYV